MQLRRFLIDKVVPKLKVGKKPETTVRKLLELANRQRRHANELGRLDSYLAQLNIRATPLIGECVSIDTKIRLGWLEPPDEIKESSGEIGAGLASSVEDVFRIQLSRVGALEVCKPGLARLNAVSNRPIEGVYLGRMKVYLVFFPDINVVVGVTERSLETLAHINAEFLAQEEINEARARERRRWWWPF